MSKVEALRIFKEEYLPAIRKLEKNGVDSVMRREEWNNFTDSLCKDRQITQKQYDSWTNPF